MKKYAIKSISLLGQVFNSIAIGGASLQLSDTGITSAIIPYRLALLDVNGNSSPSQQPFTGKPVVLEVGELPANLGTDSLIDIVIAKINAMSTVKLELVTETVASPLVVVADAAPNSAEGNSDNANTEENQTPS